ncbi:MAG TPA: trigger factor [Phycisphaerales bacterium]|nr:trigger factor [Phycisphaerales bacterium]
MADTATTERPNKVKITDAGPCSKKISIEIPAETVNEQLGSSLDTLISEAALPGFRKGHAPKRLVEKKFGSTIRKEAKNQLVGQAFSKAIEDSKLRVIGDAASETLDKIEIIDGKPLAFEVDVEVVPEFELPALEGVEIKKPAISVTDDMVNQELDRLKLNEGKLESREKAALGDYLTGHAVMKDAEGTTILDIQDAVVQIPTADKNGKGMILGVVVDDFGAQLGTPAVGSTVTIKATGPENHEDERVRGKTLTITFHPKRADRIIPGELPEIATRYGMESVEALTEAVRQRIDQRVQVDQQTALRTQIAKHLLENTTIDLPQRLTASQAARNLERARLELMYRGVDAQQVEEKLGDLRAASAASAARDLKLFFVLDRAAEKLDVKVSDAELNGRIAQIALSRGERPEKLRQDLISRNQVGTVYGQIREHKTLDAIIAKAKISEMGLEEYNKSVTEENEKSKSKASSPAKKEAKAEKKDEKKDEDKPKSKAKK